VAESHESGALGEQFLNFLESHTGGGVRGDPSDGQPRFVGNRVEDKAVGREVLGVGHDLGAPGATGNGGADKLVEQHGG